MCSRALPSDLHAQHAQLVAQIEEQLHSATLTEAQREQVEAWRGRVDSALRRWQAPLRVQSWERGVSMEERTPGSGGKGGVAAPELHTAA
jgi:hypothetical protein